MSAAIPRAAATCLAVETAAANRRFASASLRACAPPRTPGHRVTDSRRRSELSQLPNVRGAPMVLQEPPAGSPIPSLSRPNGRPFCCPIPSETSVQAGGFFRTFIRILKQGYRLRAYARRKGKEVESVTPLPTDQTTISTTDSHGTVAV